MPVARRRWSYRLGRVAGIDVRVHATFLVLLALVLVGGTDPESPGIPSELGWLTAVFACVLAHELAHSLVARSKGVTVTEIELLPIGGVSKMERLPTDARDELAIAVAGPAASVAIGVVLALGALLAGWSLWPPTLVVGNLVVRLAWFNVLIGAFNLLPAFPMDGGRVLRALLERRTDLPHATATAARVGRRLAIVMIIAGPFVNLWLIAIGAFVYIGSVAEEAATVVHERLRGLTVGQIMVVDPVVVRVDATVADVEALLRHTSQRHLPVVDLDGRYAGMADAVLLDGAAPEALMSSVVVPVPPIGPDTVLADSTVLDAGHPARAVVAGTDIVGLLLVSDVERVVRHPRPS